MATKKISELSTTTTPASGALFPIVQSSSNFSVTLANIAANLPAVTATSITSSGTITATSGFVGNITGNVTGDVTGDLTGNVTGNVSGSSGSTTGNAATATALQTARTIGGVSFDGTANINLPGVNTSGNQDTSGTAAIATTVTIADESTDTTCFPLFATAATGNLGPKTASGLTFNANTDVLSGTFAGNITGDVTGNVSGSSGSCTGNAATATALATGREISLTGDVTASGVSFDGTGNISLSTTIGANSVALGTDTTGNYVSTISGTTNEIEVSGSGSEGATVTVGLPNDVTIAGNLTVNGTTTSIDTTNLSVEDPLIKLAKNNNAADSVDIGFYGLYDTSGSQDLYSGLFRDASDSGKYKLFKDLQAEPTTTVDTTGTGYAVGTLVSNLEGNVTGNVTGNVSGSSGSTTGNAATATALETARNIGGVSFDGTGNINLPGVNTSGNQDTSGTAAIATTVTVADESSDTTCFPLFSTAATGDLAPKSGSNLTFNSSTGVLGATTFSGSGSSLTGVVIETSSTGSAEIPVGTTAQRDGSPATGMFRFNTTTTGFEGYDGSDWGAIGGGGGGATGAGGDEVFVENERVVTTSYTLSTNKSAMCVGPLTINSGVTVTIPSGERLVIL